MNKYMNVHSKVVLLLINTKMHKCPYKTYPCLLSNIYHLS